MRLAHALLLGLAGLAVQERAPVELVLGADGSAQHELRAEAAGVLHVTATAGRGVPALFVLDGTGAVRAEAEALLAGGDAEGARAAAGAGAGELALRGLELVLRHHRLYLQADHEDAQSLLVRTAQQLEGLGRFDEAGARSSTAPRGARSGRPARAPRARARRRAAPRAARGAAPRATRGRAGGPPARRRVHGGRPPLARLAPLPGSREEARAAAEAWRAGGADAEAELLTGASARRGAFLARAPGARVLHLATHAVFAPESDAEPRPPAPAPAALALDVERAVRGRSASVLCGLALAGAAVDPARGHLTGAEIEALDLGARRLVVLSGCGTALGVGRGGQRLASLQEAFHRAGASAVVASLWPVEDEATLALMTRFHRALWGEGLPPREALDRARDELRAAGARRATGRAGS